MGLTWAAGWAVAGLLIGVTSKLLPGLPWWDPFYAVFDAPLPALAVPGFFGGVFFSIVLGIAGRRRRLHELSVPLFGVLGAVGGGLLILFPFALVAVGLASREGSAVSTTQILSAIGVPFILLSALSAAGSLVLARRAAGAESHNAGDGEFRSAIDDGGVPRLDAQGYPGIGEVRPVRTPDTRARPQ